MTLLLFDRSHFNAEPDFSAFKAGGGTGIFCKATEGVGWTDPTFGPCRTGTHAAGLVFGSYHFARWGDPAAEARFYLSVASPRPGELVALDAEAAVPPGVDVVAWSVAFSQAVHAAVGAWPFLYVNQAWLAAHNWAPLAQTDGLWLAKYDGVTTGGPTGPWPCLALKQYTDAGSVPGEPGTVDVDAFQGDLPTLLRYAVPGAAPTPPGGTVPSLDATDLLNVYEAVWFGAAGAPLIPQEREGGGAWPTTVLGSMTARIARDIVGPAIQPVATAVAELQARPPVTIDQAAADLLAASLVANPTFQQVVASAASQVVSQMDADLAKRFGPPA